MSRTTAVITARGRAVKACAASCAAIVVAGFGLLGCQSATATSPSDVRGPERHRVEWEADGSVTSADGLLPDGVTVFEERYPGIAQLDPALREALRRAATAATKDGATFLVHSAWRSPEYQNQLLREAVAKYGSRAKAARWVATADTSPHVSGQAIDLEPRASAWLARHGARYGLCRVYRNEPWHFELRPAAVEHGCPARYASPARDPRMNQ